MSPDVFTNATTPRGWLAIKIARVNKNNLFRNMSVSELLTVSEAYSVYHRMVAKRFAMPRKTFRTLHVTSPRLDTPGACKKSPEATLRGAGSPGRIRTCVLLSVERNSL